MSGNIVLQIRTPLTLPPGQSSLATFKKADGYVDPHFLRNTKDEKYIPSESGNPTDRFPLVDVEQDKEVRPIVKTLHTTCKDGLYHSWCERFKNFSSWIGLVRAIA